MHSQSAIRLWYVKVCKACVWKIFSTGLIYVTPVGTEAATFGSPVQRANHCANETLMMMMMQNTE